jgi:hypothetical protein
MVLVKFNADVTPFMKGDVVRLEGAEKKRVDAAVKERGLENAYSDYKPSKDEQKAAEERAA